MAIVYKKTGDPCPQCGGPVEEHTEPEWVEAGHGPQGWLECLNASCGYNKWLFPQHCKETQQPTNEVILEPHHQLPP